MKIVTNVLILQCVACLDRLLDRNLLLTALISICQFAQNFGWVALVEVVAL